jgi:organic radical activating enzyme
MISVRKFKENIKKSDVAPDGNFEITLEITQYCPRECSYCSSNASSTGKHLSKNIILSFLEAASAMYNIKRINISGGEPLSHPNFYEILQGCKHYTKNVFVYTNAINNIIFNTDVIQEMNVEANVCLHLGEIYIPKSARKIHLLKMIPQGRAKEVDIPNISISSNLNRQDIVGDCHKCNHILLQADGMVSEAPCKKEYK